MAHGTRARAQNRTAANDSTLELKKFRNKYNLELIPASHENIILGTLVWDPLIGKPKFDHPGMPEHIFNAFLDADLVSDENWKKGLRDLRREKIAFAHLADRVIHMESSVVNTLEHPLIKKLENSFEIKKVLSFHFGNLQVRTMSNLNRIRIDNYLEVLKRNDWKSYDGKIRRVHMITELYYGSIQLILKSDSKQELEAAIKQLDLKLDQTIEFDKSIEYTFDHKNVPFAMRLERLRKFNG